MGRSSSNFTYLVNFEIVPSQLRPPPPISCHCASVWVMWALGGPDQGLRAQREATQNLLLCTKASAWPLPPVVNAQRPQWLSRLLSSLDHLLRKFKLRFTLCVSPESLGNQGRGDMLLLGNFYHMNISALSDFTEERCVFVQT